MNTTQICLSGYCIQPVQSLEFQWPAVNTAIRNYRADLVKIDIQVAHWFNYFCYILMLIAVFIMPISDYSMLIGLGILGGSFIGAILLSIYERSNIKKLNDIF